MNDDIPDWLCSFCKKTHAWGFSCEAQKAAYARMNKRLVEQRRREMEELRDWPPPERVLKRWKAHGLDCVVAKGNFGLVGYVHIPKGHPDELLHYDELTIDVHGGFTFRCAAREGGTWFGWDYAHFTDWWGYFDPKTGHGTEHPGKIWTVDEIAQEAERVAKALAERATRKEEKPGEDSHLRGLQGDLPDAPDEEDPL